MPNRSAKTLASRRWHRWRRAAAIVAVPAALLAWSGSASAQGWMADRRYVEGRGIRTGDFELHPGIGAEAGYDSNWFLRSNESGPLISNGAPAAPPEGVGILRLTPSFLFSTLPGTAQEGGAPTLPRAVAFRGGISAVGRLFVGNDKVKGQSNVAFNADTRLDINQERPVGFGVSAGYSRLIQPQVLGNPDQSFNRDDVRGTVEIVGLPGGGNLELRGGYGIAVSLFEQSSAASYSSVTHEVFFKDRWRFRPRTALFHETSLRFISYSDANRAFNYLNDSTPLRTRAGLSGLLTNRFGVILAGGYGATFFANPSAVSSTQYDSINAQVEATYYLSQGSTPDEPGKATLLLSSVALGFIRDFHNSLLANFYTSDKGYARVEYAFGNSVVMRLDGYAEKLDYPPVFINPARGAPPARVTNDFSNLRVGGALFAEYRITPAFGLNASFDYTQQFSDTQIPEYVSTPGVTPRVYDLNYQRIQAFGGVRYFF
jgi:hypothetical protein